MSESGMRASLVKKLISLDAQSIECPIKSGVPDINFKGGWIECKSEDSWPKNLELPKIFKHHLLPGQKVWMRRRIRKGGQCFLAAKVASDWFFWDASVFNLDLFGTLNRLQMIQSCGLHYKIRIDERELCRFLMGE